MNSDIFTITNSLETYANRLNRRILQLKAIRDNNLKALPPSHRGTLVAAKRSSGWTYYLQVRESGINNKVPISSSDKTITLLAKIEYTKKALNLLENNYNAVVRVLKTLKASEESDIADAFHPGKAAMCPELCIPKQKLIEEFLSNQTVSTYHPENLLHTTIRGERTRSKSESIIADQLFEDYFVYVYEYPIKLKNGKTRYVDFAILNLRTMEIIFWEHLGKMDDADYVAYNMDKIKEYEDSGLIIGVNLILTFETKINPFTPAKARRTIKNYLSDCGRCN